LGRINIDGKEYYVRFTVQEQRVTQNKTNTVPNQLHNAFVSDIEIYNADKNEVSGLGTTEQAQTPGTKIDTKLQQFFEKAREARENSSKSLDENGEPLVMYHGTGAEFTVFEPQEDRPEGSMGRGFYFTSDENQAKRYMRSSAHARIIPAFLNARQLYETLSKVKMKHN
jgi:hypothetical protein